MGKETVRYSDALVARIEELVGESAVFESKSEFHRFASDFLLGVLEPDHESSVLGFDDIREDLEAESGVSLQSDDVATGDGDVPFLHSYLQVRRSLLHGDVAEARAYVDETYDIADREALLLDELIGRYRTRSAGQDTPSETVRRPVVNGRAHREATNARGSESRTDRKSHTGNARTPGQEAAKPATDGSGPASEDESDADPMASDEKLTDVPGRHSTERSQ